MSEAGWTLLGMALGVAFMLVTRSRSKACSQSMCGSRADSRCAGENCTWHCKIHCDGACVRAWEQSGKAIDIARAALEKAKQ